MGGSFNFVNLEEWESGRVGDGEVGLLGYWITTSHSSDVRGWRFVHRPSSEVVDYLSLGYLWIKFMDTIHPNYRQYIGFKSRVIRWGRPIPHPHPHADQGKSRSGG